MQVLQNWSVSVARPGAGGAIDMARPGPGGGSLGAPRPGGTGATAVAATLLPVGRGWPTFSSAGRTPVGTAAAASVEAFGAVATV